MKKNLEGLAVGVMMLGLVGMANAAVLTFDDIPGVQQNWYGNIGTYGGFDFHSIHGDGYSELDWIDTVESAWNYGSVSGDFTMLNNYGGDGKIVASNGDVFTFDGLWARTWGSVGERSVNIEGYGGGSLIWSTNMTLTQEWTFFSGHSGAIDDLRLNLGNHFLVDNLALNESQPVPEPATMLLFGTGLAGLAAVRRRKKTC